MTPKSREEVLAELVKPLDTSRVATRKGAGNRSLSYLEGYDVIDRLNHIFGYDGWMSRVVSLETAAPKVWRATVQIEVRIGDRWLTRGDTGIGIHRSDNAEEIEKAVKEAVTDALKRAARTLGDQFGNCLYDKEAPEHHGEQREATASLEEVNAYNEVVDRAIAAGFVTGSGAPPKHAELGVLRSALKKKKEGLLNWLAEHEAPQGSTPIEAEVEQLDAELAEKVA